MERINLADAKARLSEIVDRVEAGESIDIFRRGKVIARLVPPAPEKSKVNIAMLEALHATIPMQSESAGDSVRRIRDKARY
jgi:prevent-host-death family protein